MADARRIARYIQARYAWRRTGLLRLVTRLERKRERAKVTGWLEELPGNGVAGRGADVFLKRVAGEYLRKAWRSGRMTLNHGGWLLHRQYDTLPDKFYEEILRRCPNTETGRAVAKKRWFVPPE
ncbi:MAG: hypothetical protein LBD30_05805 [Verrucomicrobiales bacterium]|nr:hypothetical protein [Verrucomicrobiales bacterium]